MSRLYCQRITAYLVYPFYLLVLPGITILFRGADTVFIVEEFSGIALSPIHPTLLGGNWLGGNIKKTVQVTSVYVTI